MNEFKNGVIALYRLVYPAFCCFAVMRILQLFIECAASVNYICAAALFLLLLLLLVHSHLPHHFLYQTQT